MPIFYIFKILLSAFRIICNREDICTADYLCQIVSCAKIQGYNIHMQAEKELGSSKGLLLLLLSAVVPPKWPFFLAISSIQPVFCISID